MFYKSYNMALRRNLMNDYVPFYTNVLISLFRNHCMTTQIMLKVDRYLHLKSIFAPVVLLMTLKMVSLKKV